METSDFTAVFPTFLGRFLDHLPAWFERRRGLLGPKAVFLTLVIMSVIERRSYARALETLRRELGHALGWVRDEPTDSAFCQARKKLSPTECRTAFTTIRSTLTRARALPRQTFHGLHIKALDGTRLTLPASAELKAAFGCPRNQAEAPCPQAGLVLLWDVGANQPMGWELGTYRLAERAAGMRLVELLGPEDVLVCDRGYPGLEFFHAIRQRGSHFIIRMNTTAIAKSTEFTNFLRSSDQERVVSFPPRLNTSRRFPGEQPLTVRFVRDPQNPERVLATSLTDPAITAADFWTVYAGRWNIEIAIREGKQWHGLEDFHARFADGIHQEVAAIMTFLYLQAEIEVDMRHKVLERVAAGEEPPEAAITQPYRFNRLLMADFTVHLLCLAVKQPAAIADEWAHAIRSLWRNRDRVRPGRSYPRTCKSPRGLRNRASFSKNTPGKSEKLP